MSDPSTTLPVRVEMPPMPPCGMREYTEEEYEGGCLRALSTKTRRCVCGGVIEYMPIVSYGEYDSVNGVEMMKETCERCQNAFNERLLLSAYKETVWKWVNRPAVTCIGAVPDPVEEYTRIVGKA